MATRTAYSQPAKTDLIQIPLAELEVEKTRWTHKLKTATEDVDALERDSYAAVVQHRIEAHRQALAEARTGRNEAAAVLAEIERQLPIARLLDLQRQSAELAVEIEKDQAELDKLRAEIGPHLEAIQALESVRYVPPRTGFAGINEAKSSSMARSILKKKIRLEDLQARAVALEAELKTAPAGGTNNG